MKVSKEKMAEHREQIITAAAKRFREKGFDGIGVADLMKEVGLTHGGFYGHFASKEELIGLASQRALRETARKWEKIIDEAPENALQVFIRYYLSGRHRMHPETGCLFASVGSDLNRQAPAIKKAVMEEQLIIFDLLCRIVPGKTKAAKRKHGIAVLAGLIGGMILARSMPNAALAEEILKTVSSVIPEWVRADAS